MQTGQVAHGNALDLLETDIQVMHGDIIAHSNKLTLLENNITDANGNILANASAVDSLFTQVTELNGSFTAMSERTAELVAEIPSSFNPVIFWEFVDDLEGWIAGGSANVYHITQNAKISGDGFTEVTLDEPIDGTINYAVTLRWKCELELGTWEGKIYYKYDGGPTTWTEAGTFSHIAGYTEYRQSTVHCDWQDKSITAIAVKFATGGTYLLDSIAIGYLTGSGPAAYIKEHAVAWVTEDEAFAQQITEMQAAIDDNTANIVTESEVQAMIDGTVSAKWSITVDANNRITGIYLKAEDGTTQTSEFRVVADDFFITSSQTGDLKIFEVATNDDGDHYIRLTNTVIEQDIASENFVSIAGDTHQGWKIAQDGSAEFSDITIYNSSGDVVLSSGTGLELDNLVEDIKDDMAIALLNGQVTTADEFTDTLLGEIQEDVNSGAASYIRTLLVSKTWINEAFIGTAHIENLSVGSSKIAYGAVSEFIYMELANDSPGLHGAGDSFQIFSKYLTVPAVPDNLGNMVAPYIRYELTLRFQVETDYDAAVDLHFVSTDANDVSRELRVERLEAQFDTDTAYDGLPPQILTQRFVVIDGPSKGLTPGDIHFVVWVGVSDNDSISNIYTGTDLTIQFYKR